MDGVMVDKIPGELQRIEQHFNVKVLFAAESGSRAWGFASNDSDYDVRFVYIRNPTDYLMLSRIPDVIDSNNLFTLEEVEKNATTKNGTTPSFIPWEHPLDFVGWDLRKYAYACMKSNSQAYEWYRSDIWYTSSDEFVQDLGPLLTRHFNPKAAHYHYLNMGFRALEDARSTYSAKKCLYALRCLLAAHYAALYRLPVPVPMRELVISFSVRSEPTYRYIGDLHNLLMQSKHSEKAEVVLEDAQWNIMSDLWTSGKQLNKNFDYLPELPDQLQPGFPDYNQFVKRQYTLWNK